MIAIEHIKEVKELAFQYGGIDGGHHKQWLIDQMLRILLESDYEEFIKEYNNYTGEDGETYQQWDEGIAP